jgi:integrase
MARKTGSQNTGYSVEKRERASGKPHWRVRIAVPDPETGALKTRIVGTFPTKTEAHKAGREAVQQRDTGTLLDPSTLTVGDMLDLWLGTKKGNVTANSHRDYEIAVRKHIKPAMGTVRLQSVTPSQLQRQYTTWTDDGMSPRMIHRFHIILNQAFTQAVRDGLLSRNPGMGVTRPSLNKGRPDVWTPDDVNRFLKAAENRPVLFRSGKSSQPRETMTRPDDLSPLWHFLVLEGMRRGEALGLRWKDVNWDRGTVHISQTVIPDKSNKGAATIRTQTKTNAGARSVRLTSDTLAALKEHRDRQRFTRQAAGDAWADNDLIVCTSLGTPVNPNNVTRSFDRLVKQAGLKRIRVHDLRHTAATMLLLAGIPAKVVSERLGHASVGITMDLYSHVLPDMQDQAAEAISNLLKRQTTAS